MTEGWVPNNDELTQCVLLIQALRDPTRSDHKMALSVSKLSAHHSIKIFNFIHRCMPSCCSCSSNQYHRLHIIGEFDMILRFTFYCIMIHEICMLTALKILLFTAGPQSVAWESIDSIAYIACIRSRWCV